MENDKRSLMVLILGMHRSGTSCLAGMLKSYGLNLGDEIQSSNNFNQKGNQENLVSRSINHDLILLNGGTWYDPKPIDDYHSSHIERIKSQKEAFREQGIPFGIKDPRMLFCQHLWRDEHTAFIGTVRHPELVYRSLEFRNQNRAKKVSTNWYDTWLKYNSQLLDIYEKSTFPIVSFDWHEKKYTAAVGKIAKLKFGLQGHGGFFDPALRHQKEAREEAPEECMELYRRLVQIAESEIEKLGD